LCRDAKGGDDGAGKRSRAEEGAAAMMLRMIRGRRRSAAQIDRGCATSDDLSRGFSVPSAVSLRSPHRFRVPTIKRSHGGR
jgi:hypothetical protein